MKNVISHNVPLGEFDLGQFILTHSFLQPKISNLIWINNVFFKH